jgi:hypothetical protein
MDDDYVSPDPIRSYEVSSKMKWIKVEDRFPELGIQHRYLFINGKGEVTFGYAHDWEKESDRYVWINDIDRQSNEVATYWMPLPEKPNEMGQ